MNLITAERVDGRVLHACSHHQNLGLIRSSEIHASRGRDTDTSHLINGDYVHVGWKFTSTLMRLWLLRHIFFFFIESP